MRMMKYGFVLMAGLAFSQAAVAGSPGWTSSGVIQEVKPREFGIDLLLSSTGNPMGCSMTGWVRLSINAANYQIIASQIFINATNKKPISFWANQCDSDGVMLVIAADAAT